MNILVDPLDNGMQCIRLSGRLDMKGTGLIDQRFTTLTATQAIRVVVDLSAVDFIASIGIRLLLSCAKANALRGGRLVLASPQPMVSEVLATAGIADLIPIFQDESVARHALLD